MSKTAKKIILCLLHQPQGVEGYYDNDIAKATKAIEALIAEARAEERANLRRDMTAKMRGWHGTGLAMIDDYYKILSSQDKPLTDKEI